MQHQEKRITRVRYNRHGQPRYRSTAQKLAFYLAGGGRMLVPACWYRARLANKLAARATQSGPICNMIDERLNYYCNVDGFSVSEEAITAAQLGVTKNSIYAIDAQKHLRYFPPAMRFDYLFGDITQLFATPTLVKSRPVMTVADTTRHNSVLLKLDTLRHYYFVQDTLKFAEKNNRAAWRGTVMGAWNHRHHFLEQFHRHPLCNIGQSNYHRAGPPPAWYKPPMSIAEQLTYKYIIAIEGNDVATNLKWILSSNSLAMMARPRYETWFMEGQLIADKHYVLLQDDYADLPEKIAFYEKHPTQAEAIIRHANAHAQIFQNYWLENLLSLLVLQRYFVQSGQGVGGGWFLV